jgi:hypothetical protein
LLLNLPKVARRISWTMRSTGPQHLKKSTPRNMYGWFIWKIGGLLIWWLSKHIVLLCNSGSYWQRIDVLWAWDGAQALPLLSYRRPKLSALEFSKAYRLCRNYQNSRKCTRCGFLSTWQNLNYVTSECKKVAIRQAFVSRLCGLYVIKSYLIWNSLGQL